MSSALVKRWREWQPPRTSPADNPSHPDPFFPRTRPQQYKMDVDAEPQAQLEPRGSSQSQSDSHSSPDSNPSLSSSGGSPTLPAIEEPVADPIPTSPDLLGPSPRKGAPAPLNLQRSRALPSFESLGFDSVHVETPYTPTTRLVRSYNGSLRVTANANAAKGSINPNGDSDTLNVNGNRDGEGSGLVPSLAIQPATPLFADPSAAGTSNSNGDDFAIDPVLSSEPQGHRLSHSPAPMERHGNISSERNILRDSPATSVRSYTSLSPSSSPYRHMNDRWDTRGIAPTQISVSRSPSPYPEGVDMLDSDEEDNAAAGGFGLGAMEIENGGPGGSSLNDSPTHVNTYQSQAQNQQQHYDNADGYEDSPSNRYRRAVGLKPMGPPEYNAVGHGHSVDHNYRQPQGPPHYSPPNRSNQPASFSSPYRNHESSPFSSPAQNHRRHLGVGYNPHGGYPPSPDPTPNLDNDEWVVSHAQAQPIPIAAPSTPPHHSRALQYSRSAPAGGYEYGTPGYGSSAYSPMQSTPSGSDNYDQWSADRMSMSISPGDAHVPLPHGHSHHGHPRMGMGVEMDSPYHNGYLLGSPSPSPANGNLALSRTRSFSNNSYRGRSPSSSPAPGPVRPGQVLGKAARTNPLTRTGKTAKKGPVALTQHSQLTTNLIYPAYEGAVRKLEPIVIDTNNDVPLEYKEKRGFWDDNCFWTWDSSVKVHSRCIRICAQCHTDRPGAKTWRRSHIQQDTSLCNKCGIYEHTHTQARPNKPGDAARRYQPTRRVETFNYMLTSRARAPRKERSPSPEFKLNPNPTFGGPYLANLKSKRENASKAGQDDDEYRPGR